MTARGARVHRLGHPLPAPLAVDSRFADLGGQPADALVYLRGDTAADASAIQTRLSELFGLARGLVRVVEDVL